MDSLEYFRQKQLYIAAQASRKGSEPLQLWPVDVATPEAFIRFCSKIPALGNYVPSGYVRQDTTCFVVAMGGWDDIYNESALSLGEFRDVLFSLLRTYDAQHPVGLNDRYDVGHNYYLGIYETGEFQVVIALYQRKDDNDNGR